ncbi:amino acid adenylation domain-containing protein [Streptomyces sp. P1-3]|uniref:amino acid adenylation domain-containing protein n=1 Tax=Streptomyces sp. P1-3 TaxID=3421658 RepID=UPI003D3633F3
MPREPIVHKVFEEHARSTPDSAAVVCAGQRLTYGELNAKANQFAHFLAARGISRGAKVGVCLDYSIDMAVAVLGTLKSGAAYVPLDPSYPAARLQLMLRQLPDLALIVVSPATVGLVDSAAVEAIDLQERSGQLASLVATDPDVPVTGDDLCYAVFTSGSTGTPKVTAARHEGWFNLLNWLALEYGLHHGSHNLVVSAFGFDLSQRSLLMPLFCGATQHLMPSRNFDAAMAYRMLNEHGVRTVHCATSALYLLVDWETARGGEALAALDYVFFGGEPLSFERVAQWARREGNTCTLLHQYGVAECTDVASSYDLADRRAGEQGVVPVGKPVYNTEIHILDEELRDVGTGEHGEICISGISVGAGYLNGTGPESERFTTVMRDGAPCRLYRTGDRGYVTQAGELVVLGRMDAQVKVRGMRIDPADVERALGRLDGVREGAVVTRRVDSGDVELIAFVVPKEAELDESDVRAGLLEALPRNMVPAEVIKLPEIPLSHNGKVDRTALAERVRQPVRQVGGEARPANPERRPGGLR